MRILIIKRKILYFFLSLISIVILVISLFFFKYKTDKIETFNPIPLNKESTVDLTGDGDGDTIKIISNKTSIDVQILSNDRTYQLSKLCDNILVENIPNWPMKAYIVNVSRNNRYELLIQGSKNGKPVSYLFGWKDGTFILLNESNYNIAGILDSNNLRTPQYIVLNSTNVQTSINSYMFQDNEKIDITNRNIQLPKIDNIFTFINLIEKKYELDELPNIFSPAISHDDLSILWSFGKENYEYSFQDGFFFDSKFDSSNNFTSIKWRLTFERYNKTSSGYPKDELNITLDYSLTSDGFKISSISRN